MTDILHRCFAALLVKGLYDVIATFLGGHEFTFFSLLQVGVLRMTSSLHLHLPHSEVLSNGFVFCLTVSVCNKFIYPVAQDFT